MLAIARGSFKSILRSPSSVAFSLGFPLLFILGFVFLDNSKNFQLPVGFDNAYDTSSAMYKQIAQTPGIEIISANKNEMDDLYRHNRIIASININTDSTISISAPAYAKQNDLQALNRLLKSSFESGEQQYIYRVKDEVQPLPGRHYNTIDFILPGQLGFALLGGSVFGIAFLFFNLRETLVLKRFFATPISRTHILFGETLSRTVFQLIAATIVIIFGYYFFDFTLYRGFWSFLQVMLLCVISLVAFMGCGFLVSALANSSSAVPALANIFTLPQFILAGTFFPIDNFPKWLQPICKALPLTHFNDAMRSICFDGATFADRWLNVLVIAAWGILIFAITVKRFRWE